MTDIRETRQAAIDARVAELNAQADAKEASANRLRGNVNDDSAFWTQPAGTNASGRAFARHRDAERGRIIKAGALYSEAVALRAKAAGMADRGAIVAGDAKTARAARTSAVIVAVGQIVDTTFYGRRTVLKVNAKSVIVEGPIKIEKQFIRAV